MSVHRMPPYKAIHGLPARIDGRVSSDCMDADGHMSLQCQVECGEDSAEKLLRGAGLDEAYRAAQHMSLFTAESQIRLLSELPAGDVYSSHSLLLDRSTNAGHLISFILDNTEQVVASTVEMVLVHVGMDSRRAIDFPSDVAAGLDELILAATRLRWTAPVSGAMGIRRST